MTLKFMTMLTENHERIVKGNSHISSAKIQSYIKQGYRPYRIKRGEIVPLMKSEDAEKFKLKFDYDAAKSGTDITVYFLSEAEFKELQSVVDKVNSIKAMYIKQFEKLNEYVASYAQHELLKGSDDQLSNG